MPPLVETVNVILIVFIIISGIAAVCVAELVSAVFLLGSFSFFVAILWGLLDAGDVSFTEAMVGVGASTIFFLLALFRTRHHAASPPFAYRPWTGLLLVAAVGALLFWGSLDLPWFGEASSPANTYLSPGYLVNAIRDMHTPNVVSAVLADYRGFDTLIETAVVFTAGVACLLIIRSKS